MIGGECMESQVQNITMPIIISIYAAIISTMALSWNIISFCIEKKSRIKVKVYFEKVFTEGSDNKLDEGPLSLTMVLVNKSKKNKYINDLFIKLPYKHTFGSNKVQLLKKSLKLPFELKPEEEIKVRFYLNSSFSWALENYKDGKCIVHVSDTTDKMYKSNKFNVHKLKESYNTNKEISPDILNALANN
jgi:viroplasmin and RNaseH domain-containing protein